MSFSRAPGHASVRRYQTGVFGYSADASIGPSRDRDRRGFITVVDSSSPIVLGLQPLEERLLSGIIGVKSHSLC